MSFAQQLLSGLGGTASGTVNRMPTLQDALAMPGLFTPSATPAGGAGLPPILNPFEGMWNMPNPPAQPTATEQVQSGYLDAQKGFSDLFNQSGAPKDSKSSITFQGTPYPMEALLQGLGGSAPMVAPPPMPQFPDLDTSVVTPDFAPADAAMQAARPQEYVPDDQDPMWGLLQGLAAAAAGVGPDTSNGNMFLQLGAGMLAGVGQARSLGKKDRQAAAERQAEYELRLAGWEGDKARIMAQSWASNQELKNKVALGKFDAYNDWVKTVSSIQAGNASRAADASNAAMRGRASMAEAMFEMSQPKIQIDANGNVTTTRFDSATGQHTIERETMDGVWNAKKGAKGVAAMGGGQGDILEYIASQPDLPEPTKVSLVLSYFDDLSMLPQILGDAYAPFEAAVNRRLMIPDPNMPPGTPPEAMEYIDNPSIKMLSSEMRDEKIQRTRLEMLRELMYDPETGAKIYNAMTQALKRD